VQQNFPIKTGETAYLFLQHFIKLLKAGGRAGVVIKNTFLSNADNASVELRKELLETCNLHTILDLPGGAFPGAGVKTVVLFFEKGSETKEIQYYQLNLDRNIGKGQPLNLDDLDEFINLEKDTKSENTWTLQVNDINLETYDLSVQNPNFEEEILAEPEELLKEIEALEKESQKLLSILKKII
jgi:type I restriction enzyme M protein